MIKECVVCGTPFLAKDGRNKFCSDECKAIRYRQKKKEWVARNIGERKEKICIICGKPFIPKQSSIQITCSEECSRRNRLNHQQERDKRNHISTMADYKARLEKQKEETRLRKEKEKAERNARWLNHLEEQKRQKAEREELKKQEKIQHLTKVCIVCGKEFVAIQSKQKTCSLQCKKKWSHRRFKKRLKGKIVDDDITLEAVYRKDLGVCYLCGCTCNWDDKVIDNGNTIVGNTYPTIEHVKPLSKGGLHEWKNIRLACFRCNTVKSNKDVELCGRYGP